MAAKTSRVLAFAVLLFALAAVGSLTIASRRHSRTAAEPSPRARLASAPAPSSVEAVAHEAEPVLAGAEDLLADRSPSVGAQADPVHSTCIGGYVENAADPDRVVALVVAWPRGAAHAPPLTTHSEADGSYTLAVGAGTWLLHAETEDLVSETEEVDVADGERGSAWFDLAEGSTVSCVVTDPDGTPRAGASVDCLDAWSDTVVGEAVSDRDGACRFRVPAMDLAVRAELDGFSPAFGWARVEPRGDRRFDLRLGRSLSVSGRVTDEAGVPISGVVVATDDGPYRAGVPCECERSATTGADGRYALTGLVEGFQTFSATAEKRSTKIESLHVIADHVVDFVLLAEPESGQAVGAGPGAVGGTATFPSSTAGAGRDPARGFEFRGTVVSARTHARIPEARVSLACGPHTKTDSSGRFEFADVRPGDVFVIVTVQSGYASYSAHFGIGDGKQNDVTIALQESTRIHGRVLGRDGKPVGLVEDVRAESPSGAYDIGDADLNGNYEIENAPEGRNVVFAEVNLPGLRMWIIRTVDVGPGGACELDLSPVPGTRLHGVVRRGARPAAACGVSLYTTVEGVSLSYDTQTDADGSYEVYGVPAGPYEIDFGYDIEAEQQVEVPVGAAEVRVDCDLPDAPPAK